MGSACFTLQMMEMEFHDKLFLDESMIYFLSVQGKVDRPINVMSPGREMTSSQMQTCTAVNVDPCPHKQRFMESSG